MNISIFKFFFILLFNNINALEKKDEISLDNDKMFLSKFILDVANNANFDNFISNLKGNTLLCNYKNYLYYISNSTFYFFNINDNSYSKISINNIDLTNANACFFNGEELYIITINELLVLDLDGSKKSNIKFSKNYKLYPKNLFIRNGIIYCFSFDNKIFAFSKDYEDDSKINLIWINNDFFDTNFFNFEYVFKDDVLYVLNGNRLCFINSLKGLVIKNVYLKKHYDKICLNDDILCLYTNMRFAFIDLNLANDQIKELDGFKIKNNKYKVNYSSIENENKELYFCEYLKRFFFGQYYFAYKNKSNGAECLFINQDNVFANVLLDQFFISHVFFSENQLILIDEKHKQFKVF